MTKRAYCDMSIDSLNFIFKTYGDGKKDDLIKKVEVLECGALRLYLEGEKLPDTYTETPQPAQIWYEHVFEQNLPYKGTKVSIVDPDMPNDPVVLRSGMPNGSM